jgi:hypothetical protein
MAAAPPRALFPERQLLLLLDTWRCSGLPIGEVTLPVGVP